MSDPSTESCPPGGMEGRTTMTPLLSTGSRATGLGTWLDSGTAVPLHAVGEQVK
jgi:hypothetical protein